MKGDIKTTFPPSHLLSENCSIDKKHLLLGRSSGGKMKKFGRSSTGRRKRFDHCFERIWKSFFNFPPVCFLFVIFGYLTLRNLNRA